MQSPTQSKSDPNPVTSTATTEQPLDAQTEAQPAQRDAQHEENKSAAPAEAETVAMPQENGTCVHTEETPASMSVTPAVEKEPSVNAAGMETDCVSQPRASAEPLLDANTNPGSGEQKAKELSKGVRDGRKYVPSKKAMIDPLKMDMSKPLVMPLSSSQLSLQCMDCHIIFSDHKSKERHLKLSHPAEYEQCILRNALFACYVCDRHFTNSTELMVHQKAHTEKKPFKCPICGLAFNKSSELTLHKKVHFGQDGYACADCGKPCKTMTLLKYHRRTHTGERPYICKECGKRFTMSKALQKHMVSHLPEGAEQEGGEAKVKAQRKTNGASTIKYPCSVCKATFKSTKTRLHHMKTKHNVLPSAASKSLPARQQVKQSTPIITPISICQPSLLQVGPNGPLQKVDANIDTEQIRRLIESLGNVQKVNQVVILGQVPPHAPPLEVQQISNLAENVDLNLNPPQIDFMGLKQTESQVIELDPSNNPCDSMEQTIILEPITPDGQLENPSFSELGSHIAAGENVEITLVQNEHTQRPEGEVMHQILQHPDISSGQSDPMEQMICQNEVDPNLEQTVILELIPTVELEQSQTVQQNEIPSSSVGPTTDLEKTAVQTVLDEQDSRLSAPPLISTVEVELTTLETEQQVLSSCPLVPPGRPNQITSESETDCPTVGVDQGKLVIDGAELQETKEKAEQEPDRQEGTEKMQIESEEQQEQVEKVSEVKDPSHLESKQEPRVSELPVSVMSAQELVKVRKRKPTRAFTLQGYMQELVGSAYNDDFQMNTTPAKRQRTKKSRLIVKFGPQSKEKKNKKQKKPSQQRQPTQEEAIRGKMTTNMAEKKAPSPKKGKKGKRDKKAAHLVSTAEIKSPSTLDPQVEQTKGETRKTKLKKQKEVAREVVVPVSEHKVVASPVFKKKKQTKIMQKAEPKNAKDAKRKKVAKEVKVNTKTSDASADILGPNTTQDALLLLKGHKQPQLKVYKLDPSKAPGQTQEASPREAQTVSESANNPTAEGKKKGGRPKKNQKALSLLSSLQVSNKTPEILPAKPKATRKRKASSKVETEGVITSHSKRVLECKDCGQRFSEVSSLQKHKTTVHVVESPGLTYTNGNIFEGVSRLDLYQLPKQHDKVMTATTDWDTEPEIAEMSLEERERSVSFPALIPSPSLPVPPSDAEASGYENKAGRRTEAVDPCSPSVQIHSPSDVTKTSETSPDSTPEPTLSTSTQTGKSVASDGDNLEESTPKNPSSGSIQGDEDVKEDLLFEVDLVTVGEQSERDEQTSNEDTVPQSESSDVCDVEGGTADKLCGQDGNKSTTGKSPHSQTVSCSTQQVEIKVEEEELVVQKKKEAFSRNAARGRRGGTARLKGDVTSKRVSAGDTSAETESEKDQDESYEKCPIGSESEMNDEGDTGTKTSEPETRAEADNASPATSSPPVSSTLEASPEEGVVLEQESVSASVEKVLSPRGLQGGEEHSRESPSIVFEKLLPSRRCATSNVEPCTTTTREDQGLDRIPECEAIRSQDIKVEENISDSPSVAQTCQNRQSASVQLQHHRDIRTVLVKEESSVVPSEAQATPESRHIRWSVEPVSADCSSPVTESPETLRDEGCITPEFNTNQCIFYPVKEEEREVLLGAAQTSRENLTEGASSDAQKTHQATDLNEGSHSHGLPSEPGISDFAHGQAEAAVEWQHPPELRDFLLQSSDEEDVGGFELSDPQLDSEAEIMAYFYKTQTVSQNSSNSSIQFQTPREENRPRKPIDFFSDYFCWDTWVEIADFTNKPPNMPKLVTPREVAQYVGIHIAMGTLKFPSPKLYWEDLTKVPLIAEAMPLSRFLELCRMLKLASLTKEQVNSNVVGGRHVSDLHTEHFQKQGDTPNSSQPQSDPLWKTQPLLCRFKAGCQSLKRQGDYAVDQYPLPLTGKANSKKLSLYCTTLIGFGGLLLHVDLKLGLSGKEDAVEKMVPKGSMVFLCKQELSTPAMLERLLVAGVHGAGRVGGARGQIGDEFVSSDGKLMLRRSHCGFILSTAGNGQRNMASLIDNFEKAQMSAHLNRDLQNLYSIPLTASSPSCWPQAVLWYLTDLALVNSWLLYRQNHRAASAPLTFMAFRLEVAKALILSSGSDTQDSVPPQPPKEKTHTSHETPSPVLAEESPLPDAATRYDGSGHWPEQLGEGEGGRCRFGDCQRTSRVLCLKCCVFLCISRNHNCFMNFHSQGSLGKE